MNDYEVPKKLGFRAVYLNRSSTENEGEMIKDLTSLLKLISNF